MKNIFTAKPNAFTALFSSAAVLIAVLGTWTIAKAEEGNISICVKNNGKVSVGTNCASGDTLLTWNIQGPAGPQGEPGPQGPAGNFGSTSRYVRTADTRIPPSTEWGGFTTGHARCDSGDMLISGGAKVNADGARILGSFPFGIGAWRGDVSNQDPVEKILTVFALCEDTAP